MRNVNKKILVLLLLFTLISPLISGLYVEAINETSNQSWEFNRVDQLNALQAELTGELLTIKCRVGYENVYMNNFMQLTSNDKTYYDTPWKDYNDKIKTVIIEKGIKSLSEGAFKDCKNLERINILGNMEIVSEKAIPIEIDSTQKLTIRINGENNNDSIISFINNNKSKIKKEVFYDISKSKDNSIIAIYNDQYVCYISGVGTMKERVEIQPCKEVIIQEGVKTLANEFCKNNYQIEKVEIASSVTRIGDYSFTDCTNLKEVIIKNDEMVIGEKTFSHCSNSLVIKATKNSTAKQYANDNNIQYKEVYFSSDRKSNKR